MNNWQLSTPILFLVFNRPDTTRQVFAEIQKVRPSRLYVAADGPRSDKPGEAEKVAQVRQLVLDGIDWDCKVKTLFRNKNFGCGEAVANAVSWFFQNEEMGIILEDDLIPDPTFFKFSEELLKKYQYDQRIMAITGTNRQFGRENIADSYYFSRIFDPWGWASWRRAWKCFDLDMKLWPFVKEQNLLEDVFRDPLQKKVLSSQFETGYYHRVDTWDYHWRFACVINGGLTIVPKYNLISNIGVGIDATHTKTDSAEILNPIFRTLKIE